MVRHPLHLLKVFCLGQEAQPLGVQLATGRVEGLPVVFAQLGPEGVQRDGEGTSVSFELVCKTESQGKPDPKRPGCTAVTPRDQVVPAACPPGSVSGHDTGMRSPPLVSLGGERCRWPEEAHTAVMVAHDPEPLLTLVPGTL